MGLMGPVEYLRTLCDKQEAPLSPSDRASAELDITSEVKTRSQAVARIADRTAL